MHRTIIKLKRDIAMDQLPILTRTVIDNFNNRAGKVENCSTDPYEFIFEGDGEAAFAYVYGLTDIRHGFKAGEDK